MKENPMLRPAIYGALLLASLSACDQIKNIQGVPALARQGAPQACIHPDTMTLLERVIRRGDSSKPVSPEEVAALPITISNTSMTQVDKGVSVTCVADLAFPGFQSKGFEYQVIPTADGSDFQIRWNDRRANAYLAAKYEWEQNNLAVSSVAETGGSSPTTASAESGQEIVLYQQNGIRLVQDYARGDVFCTGCRGSRSSRALNIGDSFFQDSWGDYVLLSRDTGNAAGGGTTYAVNLKTLKISDLQTHSGASPEFKFEAVDGGVVVVVTENGRSRRLQLEVPTGSKPSSSPAPSQNGSIEGPASPSPTASQAIPDQPARWITQPDATSPERAVENRIAGLVRLQCVATEEGRLTECQSLRETPPGYGFAAAAISSTRSARMRPAMAEGRAVPSTIQFNVSFAPLYRTRGIDHVRQCLLRPPKPLRGE